MAKYNNGIGGHVTGTVGPVIGSSWKGIPYLKGAYKRRTKRISKKEQANRRKFAGYHSWLKPILKFVRVGFKNYSPTVEGFNAAKSFLSKNALEVNGDDFFVNPASMLVSFGDLPLSADIAVEKTNERRLKFSWNPASVSDGHAKDQVMMLAYDIDNSGALFNTTGQFREAGSDTLIVDTSKGRTYHIYMAFSAHDRSRQSNSVYLGTLSY